MENFGETKITKIDVDTKTGDYVVEFESGFVEKGTLNLLMLASSFSTYVSQEVSDNLNNIFQIRAEMEAVRVVFEKMQQLLESNFPVKRIP
jgi:hypothetical protein